MQKRKLVTFDWAMKRLLRSKGRALDNIFVERLWRSLKYEESYLNEYQSIKELKEALKRYLIFIITNALIAVWMGKPPHKCILMSEIFSGWSKIPRKRLLAGGVEEGECYTLKKSNFCLDENDHFTALSISILLTN